MEVLDGDQDEYPVWEDIHLIWAMTEEEAWSKADAIGEQEQTPAEDKGATYNERPARLRFAGIRRLCETPDLIEGPTTEEIIQAFDGKEVAYVEFIVPDKDTVERMLARRDCTVTLEGNPWLDPETPE